MAKKKAKRDPRLAQGKKALEEWGIQLAAGHDLDIASLDARIGQNADADLALAALLGEVQTAESAQFLAQWEEKTPDKPLRKEISRALYRLSQKGYRPTGHKRERASPFSPRLSQRAICPQWTGAVIVLVWIVKPRVGGGLHFLSSLVNEPEGMRYIEGTEISRKMLRQVLQDLLEGRGVTMVQVRGGIAIS